MSNKYITMAYNIPISTSSEKMVLVKLADNASDEGICFPSLKTITRHTGVKKTALTGALQVLEATGLITRVRKTRKNGANSSTEYHLHFPYFSDEELDKFFDEKEGKLWDFMEEYNRKRAEFLEQKKRDKKKPKKAKSSENEQGVGSENEQGVGSENEQATIINPHLSFNPHLLEKKSSKFSFALKGQKSYENLSDEYRSALEKYAKEKDGGMSYEAFINYHGAKGSKFVNWKMAYNTWVANAKKWAKPTKSANNHDAVLKIKSKKEVLEGDDW